MLSLLKRVKPLKNKLPKGATMVEYAIMLLLIASIVFFAVWGVGKKVSNSFSTTNSAFPSSNNDGGNNDGGNNNGGNNNGGNNNGHNNGGHGRGG